MKTLYLTIILIAALVSFSKARTSPVQIIRGTVTDAVTGHHVTGSHVILKDSQPLKGTATDETAVLSSEMLQEAVRQLKYASLDIPPVQ
jgi:hypothetical protein